MAAEMSRIQQRNGELTRREREFEDLQHELSAARAQLSEQQSSQSTLQAQLQVCSRPYTWCRVYQCVTRETGVVDLHMSSRPSIPCMFHALLSASKGNYE
jgi:hypothetical protein